jgi:hypothetical protein
VKGERRPKRPLSQPDANVAPGHREQQQLNRRASALLASEVEREAVEWLWPGRIPLGNVSLLVGDPGLGKSLLTCELAARVSRQGGFALVATAEDSLAATLRPRLEAAGGELERVGFVEMHAGDGLPTGLFLPDDVTDLEQLVREHSATLVVVDPLTAHLPAEVNSWRDQSIRLALAPLYGLAERQRCAVLVVVHLNKGLSVDPLRRVGGSIGIVGAARSALLLARDPGDDSRRVLAHFECNLGPEQPSLLYKLEGVVLRAENGAPDVGTVRLVELGESELGHSDLLGSAADEEARSALGEAIDFLRDELTAGPRAAKATRKAATDAGISARTLDRAKNTLSVTSKREGGFAGEGQWLWFLPNDGEPTADLADSQVDVLSQNGSAVRAAGPEKALSEPRVEYGAVRDRTLTFGDPGYLGYVATVHRDGHITTGEALQCERMHKLVLEWQTV